METADAVFTTTTTMLIIQPNGGRGVERELYSPLPSYFSLVLQLFTVKLLLPSIRNFVFPLEVARSYVCLFAY